MSAFTYTEAEASETEAKHLVLRQVAKDVTIRLSEPLKVAESKQHTNLLSVSNSRGLVFAATNSGFAVIRLAELRSFFKSAARNSTPILDQTLRSIDTNSLNSITSLPTFVTSANNHSTVLVGFQNGAIAAWSVSGLVDGTQLEPSFVLQPPTPGLSLIDLAPNPSDRPELAVALYRQDGTPGVQSGTPIMLNLNSGSFGAQLDSTGSRATAVCWSVKGKQVAVGLESGEIVQITPEGEPKDRIARPESLQGSYYVSDLRWLENHVFVATYNLPSSGSTDDDPEHSYEVYTILRDAKQSTITFAKMPMDPAPPYGDTSRLGTRFAAWLKSWEPSKHLVFVASGPSTDVGLITCSSSEAGTAAWSTVELEETSKPILPFSSVDQSSDTAPVALDFDLTSTDEVDDPNAVARGDDKTKMPAVPILYVYTSDGVLLAYNVINTQQPFDGMVRPSTTAPTASASAAAPAPQSTPAQTTPGQTKPAASAFGSSSAFGQPSAFGQSSGFGSKSAFASSATPSFGQSSAFGSSTANSSPSPAFDAASASTPSGGFGFGAFSSAAGGGKQTSAFGSTGFGFGSASTTGKDPSQDASKGAPTPAASSNAAASPSGASAFGARPAASAFGSSSPAPSSTSTTAPSAFGSTSALSQNSSAKPAFGQSSAFGQTSAPAFGSASGFGTTSAFGASPAFGAKSAFGSAASSASPFAPNTGTATPPSTASAFGGFASKSGGAFASTTNPSPTSIFGNSGQLESKSTAASTGLFGSAAQNASTSPSPASAFGSSASKFGQGSFSAFAANKTVEDKEKDMKGKNDESSANGEIEAGNFSFGGLGSMLGSNDSTLSERRSQPVAAVEAPEKEAGAASTDPSVEGADQTLTSVAASKPFSFSPAPAPNSSGSKASDPASSNAATPPPPLASAFSSVKLNPTAGAPSDRQNSSFSNTSSSSVASTSSEKVGNNNKEQPASALASNDKSKTAEPAKPAFSFATAPAKPTASPPQFSFSSPDAKAETPTKGVKDESKPASPGPFSFAPAVEQSTTAQPSSPLTFGAAGQDKNSAEAQTAQTAPSKPATPLSFANNASTSPSSTTAKSPGFGGFGSFGSAPASSASQAKEVPSFSFASSDKSVPPPSPASGSTPAAKPTSASAPASGVSFPRFTSTAPRSSSPLAATPFSSNDDSAKSSSEEKLGKTGQTFSFQQQPAKPSSPAFGAQPATSFSGFSQPQAPKVSGMEKPTSATATAPSFGGLGPATAKSSPQSTNTPVVPGKSAKERSGSPLVAGRTPQLSSSENGGPAKVNESGIQGEFLKAYLVLTQELEVLRSNVDQCASFLADLREASPRSHSVEDFADPSKWSFGDLPKMLSLAKSLGPLTQRIEDEAASHKRKVAELQSLQLKAEAKREEVARFIRARSDPEFAKMIRVRQLGPEHVENQNKLRKASQVVRDRIVELEEYMAALKDKLQNARAGRSALRAPSLDSVARACRNITARTTAVTLDLDNLALEVDLMRPAEYASREPSRALSRSVSVVSGIEEASPLNDVSNLVHMLPAAITLRSADEITHAELVKSESVAVFINAREKPILNTRAVPSSQRADRKTTKPLRGSDLQIAFAKGPVYLGKRVPPAVPETSAANGATDVVGTDQFAPMAKEVAVPKLSEPPRPASAAPSAPATAPKEAKAAPLTFEVPPSPGPASSATPAAATQKTAAPPKPLNFSGFGQTAAAPAKAANPTFEGFASSATPSQATTTAAAPQPTVPSQPLKFGSFGQSAASAPKPAATAFSGFGKTPVSSADVSAQKGATQSAPLSFEGFGQSAAKPVATSFAGFGKASTPSTEAPSTAAPAAESQKPAAPFSFGGLSSPASASNKPSPAPFAGFGSTSAVQASAPLPAKSTPMSTPGAASSSSPFGNATLSSLDFGKLGSVPAGIFDLPTKDDTPFQPGARAASSSPSSIRSSNTSKSKFRGTAVQLPPTSSGGDGSDAAASASTKAASDFFALPPALKAKEGSDASAPTPFKGFSGFGSSAGKPNAEVSTPAPSSKPTFSFGKPGDKNESPAAATVESASASGSINLGKVDKTDVSKSPATPTASQPKTASSGFSFGGFGTKGVEAASTEQPKQVSATSFSFGDAGKKPETTKTVGDGSDAGTLSKDKVDTAASVASAAKEESKSPASFSFATKPPVKPAPEQKSEKVATDDREGEAKKDADGDKADKQPTADSKDEKSEKSDSQQKDVETDSPEKADARDATDKALPDPSTFTFCKPSEPRNKEPLTEPTPSNAKDALGSTPDAKPAASFSFGAASAAPTSEKKTEDLDKASKEEKRDPVEQPKTSSANGATSTDKADGDFNYPPKPKSSAPDSDNQKPNESSTPTSTSAFSFAPSKLNPSATSTASAFGGFKSSPGFGFGAFSSKPTDASSPSSKPVNAFSFAPQTSTANKPGAFGSASAFGSTSAFGTPSTPSAKPAFGSTSAFGTPSGFGAFAASPSTPKSTDGGKSDAAAGGKSAFSFTGASGGGFGAFAGAGKTSPFASAKGKGEGLGGDGDKSGGSLLARLGGRPSQVASEDGGEDEDEEEDDDYSDEDDDEHDEEDDEEDDQEEDDEEEEDYDEEEYTDEEDYEDEEDEVDDDDVDSTIGHDRAGGDSLEESAVHVEKADAQEEGGSVDEEEEQDDAEEDDSDEEEEDEEEGLSAVEEEPEEEEAGQDTTASQSADQSD
ncbi:hypothetical protein PHSY_004764 [Pseudozyma hubeiensis SY62]|uniref:Nucleoporin Nup159/Nup146 N-terminal domain-containing protein n=1 Tax=Pseudozyma hubeiensis (strain SY62) TaxID=1305764 RepID=R9P761_PSEHS|nr:hypothetical protein PHSY_004764 [Pseudozyma hubeiensis SY62]GAC97179.1 hypothetical protein PHSY_004764 [Pseudozyma hubeiensis SY62]